MYLTSKQHDKLQIVVSGFEIPYRSYIAEVILKRFPTESSFSSDVISRQNFPSSRLEYRTVNSELGKIKTNSPQYYKFLKNAQIAKTRGVVENEIEVPKVATIIALTVIFKELFTSLLLQYKDLDTYLSQALKYKYVRNKLDHRGCKTLETEDMTISLDFVDNALLYLGNDNSLFWDKSCADISKEVKSLQTSVIEIPVKIQNFRDMPFPNMKIVCRDQEIQEIKEFVYGRPNALRKQSSYCLYGYGGVGKTALVLETIKQIVQDIQDGTAINSYCPEFILFFSAKDEILTFSTTSGKIENTPCRFTFKTSEELIGNIYKTLGITSFVGYDKTGLVIVDNMETLSAEERKKTEEFIRFSSPSTVQYIITSRNEENYECRKKLSGFEDDTAGQDFVNKYISENNYAMSLNEEEVKTLLQLAMGNTLVLVLCLRRLSLNLMTINGIVADMSMPVTITKIEKEIKQIPANGFNIISEYMFKNSFLELQQRYKENDPLLASILRIFAVYPAEAVDLYTISMLINCPYTTIDPIMELLCRYLIVEKVGETYRLNQFAEKYIIQLFMPDSETYEKTQTEIVISTRKIQDELRVLQEDIERNSSLKKIIQDWSVISDGDKIAIAKAYKLYGDVQKDCRSGNKFQILSALTESSEMIETLEQNTMHPYVKFQKARILQLIESTKVLTDDFTMQINQAYNDTIWTIKTNSLYNTIKGTKSYASILWKYGIQLSQDRTEDGFQFAIRYLEEGTLVFEKIKDTSDEYFQCLIMLGEIYRDFYLFNAAENLQYLRKARTISNKLLQQKKCYTGRTKGRAMELRDSLKKYGSF